MAKTWHKHSTPHVHLRDKYGIATYNTDRTFTIQCLTLIPPTRTHQLDDIICTYKQHYSCVCRVAIGCQIRYTSNQTYRVHTHNMNQQINIDFICEIYAHLIIFTQPHNYVGVEMASPDDEEARCVLQVLESNNDTIVEIGTTHFPRRATYRTEFRGSGYIYFLLHFFFGLDSEDMEMFTIVRCAGECNFPMYLHILYYRLYIEYLCLACVFLGVKIRFCIPIM